MLKHQLGLITFGTFAALALGAGCGRSAPPPASSSGTQKQDSASSGTQVASAAQGGEVSGGADSYVVSPAFFRSSDPAKRVSVCYEVAEGFGVPAAEIESDLKWAFAQWGQYIEDKDLHYAIWTGSAGIVSALEPLHAGCSGGEDLRVYLGSENADVARFRPRFLNPYAFSAITDDKDYDWKKGLLWVASPGMVDAARRIPTWNLSADKHYVAFKYMLLHEIGHIFGNGHVDWTIMESNIGSHLSEWTDPKSDHYFVPSEAELRIDHSTELIPNLQLAESFKLATSYGCLAGPQGQVCPDSQALSKAFERIFGTAPVGDLKAVARRLANPNAKPHYCPDDSRWGIGAMEIEFTDSLGPHIAQIKMGTRVWQKDDSTPLFDGQHGNHYRSFGAGYEGSIDGGSGRPAIQVVVNFNMRMPLEIIDLGGAGLDHPFLTSENGY